MATEFQSVTMGKFVRSPLADLAIEYHAKCDDYDSLVCTGKYKGDPFPASSHEHYLVSRNAVAVFRELQCRAEEMGFSRIDLQQAIHG